MITEHELRILPRPVFSIYEIYSFYLYFELVFIFTFVVLFELKVLVILLCFCHFTCIFITRLYSFY